MAQAGKNIMGIKDVDIMTSTDFYSKREAK